MGMDKAQKDIQTKSDGFGRQYAEFISADDTENARSVKTRWSMFRDTLTGFDKELCVQAFVDASTPISEEAMTIIREKRLIEAAEKGWI